VERLNEQLRQKDIEIAQLTQEHKAELEQVQGAHINKIKKSGA